MPLDATKRHNLVGQIHRAISSAFTAASLLAGDGSVLTVRSNLVLAERLIREAREKLSEEAGD